MADGPVSGFPVLTGAGVAGSDLLYIIDISAAVGSRSKQITFDEFAIALMGPFYTASEVDALLVTKSDISHTHTFASLTSKPTTLAGYGITDAAAAGHTHAFADLTSKPTTLAGYGITDAAASVHTHPWSQITSTPTTLAGYGITDAAAASHTHNASDINAGTLGAARMPALTGDVTTSAGAVATTIANGAVTLAKMANAAAAGVIGALGAGALSLLTGTQLTTLLDVFTSALKGLVPASGGGTTNFLRADGTFANPISTNLRYTNLSYIIDGGGAVITTGMKGGIPPVGFAGQIDQVSVVALDGLTGSIVIDIWKANYSAWPPAVGGSICSSTKPTISSAVKAQDSTLTSWTKTVNAGDGFLFNVDSVSTFQRVGITMRVLKD